MPEFGAAWDELDDGPASTEGAGRDHVVPPGLLDLFVALEDSGVTPEQFALAFGGES